MRTRLIAALVLATFVGQTILGAVGSKKVAYVGGTVSSLPEKAEGQLDTKSEQALTVTLDKGKGSLTIPYTAIKELEYGQNAGRRVAVAILVSPIAIFSKKRNHYLTITYDDGGKEQAAVFELGKDIVRTTLTILETRSGKEMQYQDEEARKAGRGK